jgi:hydroxypyruvate reductase
MTRARRLLRQFFDAAVSAVSAEQAMAGVAAKLPDGNVTVVGAGKASAAMARALEAQRGGLSGLVIVPYGHAVECRDIEVVEAAHPVPDMTGVRATERILAMVSDLEEADTVVCLLSGGGSSLLTLPVPGITIDDKRSVTRQLLRSGAAIDEINSVRKHLSAVKGGKLACACAPASVITFAISDVPGNDATVIASGPTVPNGTTPAEALAIIDHYEIRVPVRVRDQLSHDSAFGTFFDAEFHVLATSDDALAAAAEVARRNGVEPLVLGDIEGDARLRALEHARLAHGAAAGTGPVASPCVVLSGGETTVRVRGAGRGGRNGEYALALALELDGHPDIFGIACDTDGIDGTGDNAGCVITPDSLQRAAAASIDAAVALDNNDSYAFFAALDDLIVTGPTLTNVNDFRAILVDSAAEPGSFG